MRKLGCMLALIGVVGLAGCDSDDDEPTEQAFVADFAPADGVLPFPTNLVFAGTQDLTVNIPIGDPAIEDPSDYSDPAVLADPQAALNAQAGFSTVAPARTTFSSGGLDPDTLDPSAVRVFEVTLDDLGGTQPVAGPVSGVTRELSFGEDFVARLSPVDDSNQTLSIVWLAPLAPATSYLVTLTNGISSADGRAAIADTQYVLAKSDAALVDDTGASQVPAIGDAQAQALEPVRQLTNAQLAAAASRGVNRDNVILSWVFTTQGIGAVLTQARTAAADADLGSDGFTPFGDTAALGGQGLANVFQGLLNGLPYYLAPADTSTSPSNDPAPLRGFWQSAPNPQLGGTTFVTRFNPVPQANATESLPVLVTLPSETSGQTRPADGWPVVMFVHGVTANRTAMLGIADRLAAQGFAMVGIDQPLHGVTDTTSPLFVPGNERTFDLDLQDNATGEPGPDGNIDASGAHFINLQSLLTARDNLRESAADLFALRQALDDMDVDGGGPDFDTSQVSFLGHSLGGIVGGVFLALETDVGRATLANPGGGVAKLLDGSATFGPQIAAGLQTAGIEEGTPAFESFLAAAQTLVDTADPINYTAGAVANHELYTIEVLGDQVVPNAVQEPFPPTVPSPTAGTDPLAALLGLDQVSTTTAGPGLDAIVRFTEGHHSSILTPNDAQGNPDSTAASVFTEMQNQAAIFLDTGDLVVDDGNFVQ